ncbi:CHAT domain-containing protein [Sphingomonas sp. dw_22]|uniref:CHAT domain-containing protein n=1 Tax=Sphingomonas sp. dw_22 TaxID=2721175 RepID=UPI001BD55B1D|nr:CHAT domain-containing protein [Sphingomonas sp. dw_22]
MDPDSDINMAVYAANGLLRLRIVVPQQPHLDIPLSVTPGRLPELRKVLSTCLLDMAKILQDKEVEKSSEISLDALRQLYAVGSEIGIDIFGCLYDSISQSFQAYVPGWNRDGNAPPRVYLDGTLEYPLPLEFVPLFNTADPDFNDPGEIAAIARRFPVFSTIFCRSPMSAVRKEKTIHDQASAAKTIIDNQSPPLVRLFVNEDLDGVAVEHAFFRQLGACLRGPWPDVKMSKPDFLERLSQQIWDAACPGEPAYPRPDDVQHFVCHYDTTAALSRDHTVQLGRRVQLLGGAWSVVSQYSAALRELLPNGTVRAGKGTRRPLVFLNACASSDVTPEGVMSFPGMLLEWGGDAVIGTEVAVPDMAAAEFARLFYTEFLAGKTLGEAIYEARAALMRVGNPIGAIYSAYALPGLRLKEPAI